MNLDSHPREYLAAAEERVVRAYVELQAARERARSIKKRADWLEDRPDLLSADSLINDIPRRQTQYGMEAKRFGTICHERIRELSRR